MKKPAKCIKHLTGDCLFRGIDPNGLKLLAVIRLPRIKPHYVVLRKQNLHHPQTLHAIHWKLFHMPLMLVSLSEIYLENTACCLNK